VDISLSGATYGGWLADIDLEEGRLVAVALGDDIAHPPPAEASATWHADDQAHLATLLPRRGRTWVGGRMALRRAIATWDARPSSILADDRGAPILPAGVVGSIGHKDPVAVALAAPGDAHRVGVDVELMRSVSTRLTSKILGAHEALELLRGTDEDKAFALLLAFSAKEAVYKAIDPFVRRYVGFHEVRLHGEPSRYAVEPLFADVALEIDARSFRAGDVVIAVARAQRRSADDAAQGLIRGS